MPWTEKLKKMKYIQRKPDLKHRIANDGDSVSINNIKNHSEVTERNLILDLVKKHKVP